MTTLVAVTPETLTFEHIKQWSGEEMKLQMAHPEMREAITDVIKNKSLEEVLELQASQVPVEVPPSLTEEEIVAEAQKKQQEESEAQRIAAEQEAARKAAEPKKFVVDYQVKDEDGNPIGRPTHLEASSQEELTNKIIEAHVQATRAFHRLKKQKISFKEPPIVPVQQASDAELLAAMKDLKSDDPQKQLDAVRRVQRAEVDKIQAESDRKIAEATELRRQEDVSRRFLQRHKHDFNNNEANRQAIKEYFEENELQWTDDNLEICLHALESKLAPVESVAPVVPANPVPVVPVVQVAPPVVQPVVSTTVPVVATANPVAAAPRPGVNGGIVPGQNSGSRPVITTKQLTAEEIKSWDGATMRAKMRNPAIKAQIEAFFAARNQGKK